MARHQRALSRKLGVGPRWRMMGRRHDFRRHLSRARHLRGWGAVLVAMLWLMGGPVHGGMAQTPPDIEPQAGEQASAADRGEGHPGLSERAIRLAEQIRSHDFILREELFARLARQVEKAQGWDRLFLLYRLTGLNGDLERWDEARRWAARLEREAAEQGDATFVRIAKIYEVISEALSLGYEKTLDRLKQLRDEALAAKDPVAVIQVEEMIALTAPATGQVNRALVAVRRALENLQHYEGPLRPRLAVELSMTLGYVYAGLRDLELMVSRYESAVEDAERSGEPIDGETIIYNIARVLIERHQYETARRLYEILYEIAATNGRPDSTFYPLYGLALTAFELEDFQKAVEYAHRAWKVWQPDVRFAARLNVIEAIAQARLGHLEAAEAKAHAFEQFLADHPEFDRGELGALKLRVHAELAAAKGDTRAALALMRRYVKERVEAVRQAFTEDVQAIRARLETEIGQERAERALAEQRQLLAAQKLREQQLWVALFGALALFALVGFLYQRRMAGALEEARRRAESASQAKSAFLANISHELRTPLNAIIGFSELVVQEMFGPLGHARYREYGEAILRSGRHLLDIINNVLDLSRVEAGRMELQEETISIAELVGPVVSMLLPAMEKREQQFVERIEDPDLLITVDSRLLRQALINLLSNASKFTPQGGEIRLEVVRLPQGDLMFAVVDNGIGMDEQEIRVALEPFGQVQSVMSRNHEGSGLGLTLVKTFVELHGGRFILRSRKGEGTRAEIRLPARRVLQPANQREGDRSLRVASG